MIEKSIIGINKTPAWKKYTNPFMWSFVNPIGYNKLTISGAGSCERASVIAKTLHNVPCSCCWAIFDAILCIQGEATTPKNAGITDTNITAVVLAKPANKLLVI